MKIFRLITCTTLLMFTSCNTAASSIYFYKGTQCLQEGNFEQAIVDLKKAVELNPTYARNHVNLCAAYMIIGDDEKAWYHSRQSRMCRYGDNSSEKQFENQCDRYIHKPGLDRPGTSYEEVISKLGAPDLFCEASDSTRKVITYGTFMMIFDEGKLIECRSYTSTSTLLTPDPADMFRQQGVWN